MALLEAVSKQRSDVQVLTNDLLCQIKGFGSVFIPVNSFGKSSLQHIRQMEAAFKESGVVIIFPAGQPIYHGVGAVSKSNKYFIRCYWGWDYEGSSEWHLNKEKYGEEGWKEIENKRIKKEFHEGTHHIDVIWNEEEKFLPKYIPNENDPTLTPFYSPYPKIKMGKGNE